MLKKLSVALCVSSLLGCGVAIADPGTASGSIKFVGSVSHQAPSVLVKFGETATALSGAATTIQLTDCYAAELDGGAFLNDKAKSFQIVVQRYNGTGYNHITSATLELSGTTVETTGSSTNGWVLKNNATVTPAGNVGVGLRYLGKVAPEASSMGDPVFATSGSRTITETFAYEQLDPTFYFKAALQQVDTTKHISGGNVEATLNVTVTYQ